MSEEGRGLFWLTDEQFACIQPLLPTDTRGKPQVDDQRVISGIIHVIRNGLRWKDAPSAHGPHKTLYNRFRRWGGKGSLLRWLQNGRTMTRSSLMRPISRRTALLPACCCKKGYRCLGRSTRGGLNSKLHVVCNAGGKPLILSLAEGQFSDCKAAFGLIEHLPPGSTLIADKAHDSHRLRQALRARKIRPCIPVRKGQWDDGSFDPRLYRQRNVIERFFGRLKDFRHIAMRHDRCPISFFTAITIAAIVIAFLRRPAPSLVPISAAQLRTPINAKGDGVAVHSA